MNNSNNNNNSNELTESTLTKLIRVGASDAHSVCEMSDDCPSRPYAKQFIINLFFKIKCYITGKPIDCKDNEHTLRGKTFEPKILELYKERNKNFEVYPQGTYECKDKISGENEEGGGGGEGEGGGEDDFDVRTLIIARTDGVVRDKDNLVNGGEKFPLEIKCPSKQYESVPIKYYIQLQVQMLMMGKDAKMGHFLSIPLKEEGGGNKDPDPDFEPELDVDNALFARVDRDEEVIEEILGRIGYVYGNYLFNFFSGSYIQDALSGDMERGNLSSNPNNEFDIENMPDVLFEEFKVDTTNLEKLKF